MTKKRVDSNPPATGGITGKGFVPGQSGNPGGRKKLPDDLKAALAADSLPLYEKAKQLAAKAEKEGDLKTAATIVLGLLKKTVPDAQTLLVGDVDGKPLQVMRIDPKTLTKAELDALIAVQRAQTERQSGRADVRTEAAKEE